MKSLCASMAVISLVGVSVATAAPQAFAPSASAPTLVRVDGQLKTPTGDARTGRVTLVVSLYAEQEDATPLWVEPQVVTLDPVGRYALFAGATLPDGVPQELLSGATPGRWLGVAVQGEAEQFRMRLVTVPYAAKAREADTLAGKAASDFVLTEHFSDSVQKALKTSAAASLTDPGVALTDNQLQRTTGGGAATIDSIIFDNGSSIGLGTTGPGGTLDVRGPLALFGAAQGYTFINNDELNFGYAANATYEGNLNYHGYLAGATQFRDLGIFNGKGSRIAFFQGSTSRVGIGTTGPVLPLTVVSANPFGALGAYTSNTGQGVAFNPSVTAGIVDIYADYLGGAEPKLHLSTYTNRAGAGGLTIDTAGNVGIGTTGPGKLLHISTSTNSGHLAIGGANQNALMFVTAANSTSNGFLVGRSYFSDDANTFFIYDLTASTNRLLIDASGNVGIGTTIPNLGRLHVEGGDENSAVYGHHTYSAGVVGDSVSGTGVYGNSNIGQGVHGLSHGGSGVSGDSVSANGVEGFSESGNGVFGDSVSGWAGFFYGKVSVTGNICANNISCASDARLKQNVTPLSYGLHEVLRLRPVRWQWKDTTTTQLNLGLVAQDVEPVLPELILRSVDAKGSLGLNYMGLVPVVIKAIQEQQDTITTLNAENTTLRQHNAALDARVTALEQALQQVLGQPPGQAHPSRVSRSDR